MEKIRPPWDAATVAALNAFQCAGVYHPFTCRTSEHGELAATAQGWECRRRGCGYTQDWAHAFMVTREARTLHIPPI